MEGKIQVLMNYFKITVLLILIALFFVGCNSGGKRIEGVPFTQSYNKCESSGYDFGKIITIGDSNNKFMISLPYEWDIQESYSDTLYGIIATNTYEAEENPAIFMLLSVTGYSTEDSLYQYFTEELKTLKKDKQMNVREAGEIDLNGNHAYWIKFENNENNNKFVNLVHYVKSTDEKEVYLIHSCVANVEAADEKICALKKLAASFELVDH